MPMPSILQSNLEVLSQRDPELANRIAGLGPGLPPYLELIEAKSGLPAVRYHPPGDASARALCSVYDPVREADRWAENEPVNSAINLVFLGVGLGYHIVSYLDRFGTHARSIALVEFDPHLFRLALSMRDLRGLIGAEPCFCFVGEPSEVFPELLKPLRTNFMVHNFKILHHTPTQQINRQYYVDVAKEIVDVVTFDGVNTKTVLGQRQTNQQNIIMNLHAFWRGRMPAEYRDAAQGTPAVVVAAGPSLDRNIDELKELNNRGLIISADTSQNTLSKRGIRPHIVVAADPTELNFSHFERIQDLDDTILAFHPESHWRITRKYPSHPYLFPLVDEQGALLKHLSQVLENILGEVGHVPRGMNVGQIAFNIAVHLGCDPIILIGMDLAFSPQGGTSHAADAAVSRTTSAVGADRSMTVGGKEGKADSETGQVVFVPGYFGGEVPTSVSFRQYIRDLEQNIRKSGARVIDATEGGALKQGTEIMTFKEAMLQLGPAEDVTPFLERFRSPPPQRPVEPLISELQKGRATLADSKQIAEQALQHIASWPELASSGTLTPQQSQNEWNRLEDLWQSMLADPLFNTFLDASVTYLYYRRQRSDPLPDESPATFLRCMYNKYQFILSEMNMMLEHFINLLDQVCAELSGGSA